MAAERKTITDFGHPSLLRWSSVNDVVMGSVTAFVSEQIWYSTAWFIVRSSTR